ncbi:MAG: type I glyceraldehyde-3-phosphate dehydrogenase [Candidatus Sumerlaeia bacterium]|nr:type I glyceraldehyde-3-phosphate dehydrogenase [Candidatus Sumerlaeia bacterium]
MAPKVAINGFGRIGRLVFRAAIEKGFDVVSINDLAPIEANAHLLKYDSVHGRFQGDVKVEGTNLVVNGKTILCTSEKDPAALPHDKTGAQFVVESTGRFTDMAGAGKHLKGNVQRVIISAPGKDVDYTVVLGVNCASIPANAKVISNASCTTNCLAPVVKAIDDGLGVVKGLVTTIHSYTNDQQLLDLVHKDMRRARAGAVNMIPSTTGAAKAIGLVMPHLKGKLDGLAVRVPTPNVSLVDFVAEVKKETTKDEVNAILKKAATEGPMAPYLNFVEEELVSSDFNHDPASSSVDAKSTYVVGNMVKVLSWYDNEWGYSSRVIDLIAKLAK